MTVETAPDRPYRPLLDWLAAQDVEYEIRLHDQAETARATADAEGVDPRTFAKVIGVLAHEGRYALIVVEATDRVDLDKARRALGSDLRLLTEREMAELTPGCAVGAMLAVGPLFGLPTYADYDIRDDPEISFNAGSHCYSVRVDRPRWEHVCDVIYADLAARADSGPAWARS